jgi:hypothetical protein
LEILHGAAGCHNVPATFTLAGMNDSHDEVFVLAAAGLTLRIAEVERTSGDASNPYDWWINFRVEIAAENFQGCIHWSALQAELLSLAGDLEKMNAEVGKPVEVAFEPAEPGVKLRLRMNERGQIAGEYEFTDTSHGPRAPRLIGMFTLDQTFLGPTASALRRLVAG